MFRITLALAFLIPSVVVANDQKATDAERKAVESAETWIALVDQEKYGESWEAAAAYLKNAVTKENFGKSLTGARKPLGKVTTRKLMSKTYLTSLPGAPDGEYVIIRFETAFENEKESVETITPMLDKDGKWKVSGYYIK